MERTLGELAHLVGGELRGDARVPISGVAPLEDADSSQISFVANPRYSRLAKTSRAGALIVPPDLEELEKPCIVTRNPYLAFARILALFTERPRAAAGVSSRAYLAPDVRLGSEVAIYPQVYVGEGASLGDRVVLYPGVYVGDGVQIGEDCIIYPGASILDSCLIGRRVIIHSGAVVGSDGFGFAQDGSRHVKIPQAGIVQIDDDVEIGANCTIDRATMGKTWIQRGVKIDNLVQVAHNVVVGEDSIIIAQVGISGSARIGKNVILAGQVGVAGHLEIGEGVQVGAQSGIAKSIPAGQTVSGSPAIDHRTWLRTCHIIGRLPEMRKQLLELEKRLAALEQRVDT